MDLKLYFLIVFGSLNTIVSCFASKQDDISTAVPRSTILWWSEMLFPHIQDTTTITCGESRCISTRKKKIFSHLASDIAFLFYGTDFNPENLPLPRSPCHIWALLHEESPFNNYIFSHSVGIELFNYTSTFSRHSDYPLTTQFIPDLDYITQRKPVPIQEKNKLRSKGLAPVVYVQTHCNAASDRDRYVKELMKHINIDSYGTCLHNKNLPSTINTTDKYEEPEFLDLIAQYKFTIAFENAICDDYITEKLLRPLHVGSVPIYRGSPSVMDWTPAKKSVILANSFASPKDLADFITMLDKNDELYESYMTFKDEIENTHLVEAISNREWGVNDEKKTDFIKGFECFICRNMYENHCSSDNGEGFRSKTANRKHMSCHQPYPSLDTAIISPKDEWMKEDWIESYWFALDQAKTIHRMIVNNESNSGNFWKYLQESRYDN